MNPHEASSRTEDDSRNGPSSSLPKKALVQCDGYRCMAFRGPDGTWKDARDKPVKVLKIIQEL